MSHRTRRTQQRDVLNVEHGFESVQASHELGGPVEAVDDSHQHHCNDHIALIHESREEQFAAVVPYLREGIAAGERCLYVVEDTSKAAVVEALRAEDVDVDAALERGQLTFHSVEETYHRNGEFRPDEMVAFYTEAIAEATEEHGALRVAAETGWLLDDSTDLEAWMEYEARVNELCDDEDCLALCQYDRTRVPPDVLRDLVQTHPHLVYGGTVCHNFYYTPPEEFLGPDRPGDELDRMIRTLVERTRANADLREQREYLRRQNEITGDPDRTFEEKLQALFELGCERFGLEFGGMARVDPGGDRLVVEHTSEDRGAYRPGLELSVSEAYCGRALAADGPVGVADPDAAGCGDTLLRERFGIESYLGTHVRVEGGLDRTFYFQSEEPREAPFTADEREFLRTMGQWVTYELERQHCERQLDALNGLNRSLMGAATVSEVTDRLLEAADSLGLASLTVGRYDADAGELRCAGRTDAAARTLEPLSPFESGDGVGWEAFLKSEPRRRSVGDRSPAAEVVAVPLCSDGVVVAALPGDAGESRLDFLETVAANVATALERASHEQQLRAREAELEEQKETLTRLDRINTTIRDIDGALVSAASRSEIESVVCERLAEAGPYTFAWVAAHDSPHDRVTPEEQAATGEGYLADVAATDPTREAQTLADQAAAARETRVVNDLMTGFGDETWQQAALERGYHAAVALPLIYEDTMFGVLTVFADQPGVFDDLERTVLTELSDTIAHAINAVESKRSLVDSDVTELTFEVPITGFPFDEMVRETGGVFEHEGVVSSDDDDLRWFFSARGVDGADVAAFEPRLSVSSMALLEERDVDGETVCLFEVRHPYEGLPKEMVEHGGQLHDLRAAGDSVSITVDVHAGADVREFVEMFRTKYPDAELVAKRDRERSVETVGEFTAALTDDLTPRQREVIETAYYSGYFEEPRTRTGGEIAGSLDISQPTFTTHLRNAERRIYG